jgi:phenylpropionate dioxygenase-like ring-hydroxylating dioxygenase large terminal subunit
MNSSPVTLDSHAFVAATSGAVGHRPLRVRLFGAPVVLFRTRDGGVAALEDRCAHRGVPLSAGETRGDSIICRYHGWGFGPDGSCVLMPGAPGNAPVAPVRISRLHTRERDGFVWVSAQANAPLPQRVESLDPKNCRFRWQTIWQAPVVDVQENFLDALHTHSVHPGLVRRPDQRQPMQASLTVEGDGFQVDYIGQPEQSGLLFRLFESRRSRERAYFSGCAAAQLEFVYAAGWTAWITLYCTPADTRSTHVFASLHLDGRRIPRWLVRLLVWPFIRRVAKQDQRIVELQERANSDFPGRLPVITPMDVVRPYVVAAWGGAIESLPRSRSALMYL